MLNFLLFYFAFLDYVPGMLRPYQEHDLPLWPWDMPAVWRSNVRVPYLPQACGEEGVIVLEFTVCNTAICM